MGFLSEAITSMDRTEVSPFTESIILATIIGRTLSHRQQSMIEPAYSPMPRRFWDRHEWLYGMVKTLSDGSLQRYPLAVQHTDCMLLFTKMMTQTTVLYLCRVMESMSLETEEYRNAIFDFKQKSLLAAKEVVDLTRSLPHLSSFKVDVQFFSTVLISRSLSCLISMSGRLSNEISFQGSSIYPATSGALRRFF